MSDRFRFRFRAWDKKNKRMLYNIQETYDGACIEDKDGEEVEGELVNGSMFNGDFVKETPEEILQMIKEAENAK